MDRVHDVQTSLPDGGRCPVYAGEMGQAIQAAAPDPGDLALVIGGGWRAGSSDVVLRRPRAPGFNVWSIWGVQERLTEDWADLVFNFDVQPWEATAAGVVFPRWWDDGFGDVRAYLEERYPAVRLQPALAGKFAVFRVPSTSALTSPSLLHAAKVAK